MADIPNPEPQEERKPTPQTGTPPRPRLAALADRFLTRKWLGIILAVSVAVHTVGFSFYKLKSRTAGGTACGELSLGEFCFATAEPAPGKVAEARFSLHLALLDEVALPARKHLEARKFRVQQDVEELLRRAHGTDFDDPALAELKRQLQEQINRTLGLRAVADVIITDLHLRQAPEAAAAVRQTAESLPWVEPPAG